MYQIHASEHHPRRRSRNQRDRPCLSPSRSRMLQYTNLISCVSPAGLSIRIWEQHTTSACSSRTSSLSSLSGQDGSKRASANGSQWEPPKSQSISARIRRGNAWLTMTFRPCRSPGRNTKGCGCRDVRLQDIVLIPTNLQHVQYTYIVEYIRQRHVLLNLHRNHAIRQDPPVLHRMSTRRRQRQQKCTKWLSKTGNEL